MRKRTLFLFLAALLCMNLSAQRRGRSYANLQQDSPSAQEHKRLNDTITTISRHYEQQMDSLTSAIRYGTNATGTSSYASPLRLSNPYFYPLFAGNTLFPTPLSLTFGSMIHYHPANSFIPPSLTFTAKTLCETYAGHPEWIRFNLTTPITTSNYAPQDGNEMTKSNNGIIAVENSRHSDATRKEAEELATNRTAIKKEKEETADELDLSDFHINIRRPNFWNFKGSFSMQFMQYHVSDNWYKGGDDHNSMLANFNFEANYDNKQKLTINNRLETKLGFQSNNSDTYHKFKTNADQLRLTNKIGLQAHKHWYYTLMLQSWTQFYKSYDNNSDNVASNFLSPFETVLSLGMDYKLSTKRINLTATLSPIAGNLKYCKRDQIVTRYGIDEGKHVKTNYGSTATVNMVWKICNQINWQTRFYTFYDYTHLWMEWENTVNLKVNKYLSTKLFLYPRFDNSVQKNDGSSFLQFNEYISVGLDVNF